MKIVADENMSEVQTLFSAYGDVLTLAGSEISRKVIRDASVLLVRSVTRVDQSLLEGSAVKFVGSATIGTDHIDLDYLRRANIRFAHAPGCNANAVVQYMFSVFCTVEPQWRSKSIGIIGCGNVGGRLLRCLNSLGVHCKVYDPYLSASSVDVTIGKKTGAKNILTELDDVLQSDIVCLHAPLSHGGDFPTIHMINQQVLEDKLNGNGVLINAARGGLIDNQALLAHLDSGADLKVVLDVWENEPNINLRLLQQVRLATPHIAGYSEEGRLKGSLMVRDALGSWLGVDDSLPETPMEGAGEQRVLCLHPDEGVEKAILTSYRVAEDDRIMRSALLTDVNVKDDKDEKNNAAKTGPLFSGLRKHYLQRREFGSCRVELAADHVFRSPLKRMGFVVS